MPVRAHGGVPVLTRAVDERALAAAAFDEGLAVTRPDGTRVAIPISSVPEVRSAAELDHARRSASALARGIAAIGRAVLRGELRDVVRPHLSPLERRLAEVGGASLDLLAVTRTDFFDGAGLQALELNATIPAMQAYGDIAARCWVTARANALGVPVAPLLDRLPSNARALLDAVCGAWRQRRPGEPASIAVLVRRADAQLSEIEWLAASWRRAGHDAFVLFPDEVDRVGGRWFGSGRPLSLVYRHLFVRRLEQTAAPQVEALLSDAGPDALVVNPPASQLEVKAVLALLSECLSDRSIDEPAGIDHDTLAGVVPWTRVLRHGATTDEDGRPEANLVGRVAAHPERYVVKRSWDYGGRAVFIGPSAADVSFAERAADAFGRPLSWSELVAEAASQGPAAWVVQRAVPPRRARHRLCTPTQVTEADCYVDLSHYASVGLDEEPAWSGVVRGSTAPVVNIVGGGGVLPLIPEAIAATLEAPPR